MNGLSIDVEDYFHVSIFARRVSRADWNTYPSRVVENTHHVLDILAANSTRATFFVLGWVARRFPELVREIAGQGHEVALHGYYHQLVSQLTPDQFRVDILQSKDAIEAILGRRVEGYRAPSFSINESTFWALDILRDLGFTYDSSIFPIMTCRNLPRGPFEIIPNLYEVPLATVKLLALRLPVAGGVFLRAFPFRFTCWAVRRLNSESLPAVVYLHPWELDADQPRICATSPINRVRHYINLRPTGRRLDELCRQFSFHPLAEIVQATKKTPA